MTHDTQELVTRLQREIANLDDLPGKLTKLERRELMLYRRAADMLTAQAEEIRALREALAPFADIADLFDCEVEGHADTDELSLFYGDGANWLAQRFTLAQFISARAALAGKGKP